MSPGAPSDSISPRSMRDWQGLASSSLPDVDQGNVIVPVSRVVDCPAAT